MTKLFTLNPDGTYTPTRETFTEDDLWEGLAEITDPQETTDSFDIEAILANLETRPTALAGSGVNNQFGPCEYQEEWRPIMEWKDPAGLIRYAVSNKGRVKALERIYELNPDKQPVVKKEMILRSLNKHVSGPNTKYRLRIGENGESLNITGKALMAKVDFNATPVERLREELSLLGFGVTDDGEVYDGWDEYNMVLNVIWQIDPDTGRKI